MKPERLKKLRAEGQELSRETRERTTGYLTAALGLVAALAWNDAITGLIEHLFPLSRGTVTAKFVYALILTVIVVLFTTYFISLMSTKEKK